MKKIKLFVITVLTALTFVSCGTTSTVPLTGRQHRISVSDEYILSLSNQEYKQYMAKAKKSTDVANTALVQRVGKNLANAVVSYLKSNGYANEVNNFAWEFNLVADKSANAFCMPGGKIVVYEGLLPYTQNETSLAIVLGHEIAHAVAKHSAEQITKQKNQQMGTSIVGNILNQTIGGNVGNIAAGVAGQYFSFKNLKYSRENELEADNMGLIFAAMAGYDPEQAIPFWKRMSSAGGNTNELLSDHPSDATRINALQKAMPTALKYYKPRITTSKKTTERAVKKSANKRK